MRRSDRIGLSILAVAALSVLGLRQFLGVTQGLRADYFPSAFATDVPERRGVDAQVSTDEIARRWADKAPRVFTVRWFGYLTVPRTDRYTLAVGADAGVKLWIDGALVADDSGRRPPETRTGPLRLESGAHTVLLDYTHLAGEYRIGWQWEVGDAPRADVPAWRLTPNRVSPSRLLMARALDLTLTAVLAGAGLWIAWILLRARRSLGHAASTHPHAAVLLLFVALTVFETWPLAANPAHLSRNDNADTILNEWTLAWFAHQLPRHPTKLYDANIFYPERRTLAYSESMIVQSALAAPLLWSGASPVLAYNLVLMAGFALSGWTMALVMHRWTSNWVAAIASGTLLSFNAQSLTRLPHLQALHVEFLPLALLAFDELLRRPRVAQAVRLALWFTLQALTSVYLLVFTTVALVAAALVRPREWIGRPFRSVGPQVLLAGGLAAAALLPSLLPYWTLHHDVGIARTIEEAGIFTASWDDYLATPSRIHYPLWSYRWFGGAALFPGFVGLGLAAFAAARGVAFSDARARMCLALGICGMALSFGTHLPGYALLFRWIPLFQAIRAVSRFGFLALAAVAALAGFGVAELKRVTPPRAWPIVAAAVLGLVTAESYAGPLELTRPKHIPAIYELVRREPQAIVVELPFYTYGGGFEQAPYLLNSTRHWKPMLNGYSGFHPGSFYATGEALARFPDPSSVRALQSLGVTHVFIHADAMTPESMGRLGGVHALHPVASERDVVLFALDRP